METWVAHGGQRYGPYSRERLDEMLAAGQIAPGAQVWLPETSQWINAQELPGFRRPGTVGQPPALGFGTPAETTAPPSATTVPPYPPPYASTPAGQSPYAVSPYPASSANPQPSTTNNTAVAALVVGILALFSVLLLITIILAPAPVLLGILAIILGFVARSQIKQTGQRGGGMAISGIVLGFISLALVAAAVALLVWAGWFLAQDAASIGLSRVCTEAVKADLRNAATSQETFYLDHERYTTNVTALTAEGWMSSAQALNCGTQPLAIPRASTRDYCMEMGTSGNLWSITKDGLRSGACVTTTAEGREPARA